MADPVEQKSSAEIEREVEQQRARIETDIGDIRERLSPGSMVDELIAYAKNSGGGDFVANLGERVTSNPLPVALIGVSLLWLMAKPAAPAGGIERLRPQSTSYDADQDYGYATVEGPMRFGYTSDEHGRRYGQLSDRTGRKFRALADTAGNRAGQFTDDAGATFRGFRDAAGNKIEDFRDEAGQLVDQATNWASDAWQRVGDAARDAGSSLSDARDQLQQSAASTASTAQRQATDMSRTLIGVLHDQPLVAGALAFAVGAAIASAFPHTAQEDKVFGEASDKLKDQAAQVAGDAYEKGKAQVADAYDQVTAKAADIYAQAKDGVAVAQSPTEQ